MAALPLRPAALLVITNPPQSPGPGVHTETRMGGQKPAAASDASTGEPIAVGLSFRLVKMALRLVGDPPVTPDTVSFPPLMVIGPPSDLTTSPLPTKKLFPWKVRTAFNRYPRACVDPPLLGFTHVRSLVTLPSNTR